MENIEKFNEEFDVKKPKKKKGLLITAIVTLIIIVALVATYFIVFTSPKFIFSKVIDKMFASKKEVSESIKLDYTIKASVDTNNKNIKEYTKELEKCSLRFGTQMDIKSKQEIIDLGLDYNNEEVINAQLYYDSENIYVYLNEIFNKYIELDIPEETKQNLEEIYIMMEPEEQKKSIKMQEILRDEIKTQIKEEGEFEKGKTTLEINGEEENVTKYTLKLSQKALIDIMSNVVSNLSENEEFLESFENEEIKETLEKTAKALKESEKEIEEDIINIKINLYTKGLTNKFVGADIETNISANSQNMKLALNIIKEDKDKYSYAIKMNALGINAEIISGNVEIQKEKDSKNEKEGKIIVSAKSAIAQIEAKLEIDYLAEYDKGIDKIDVSNSVEMTEITEKDLESMLKKLKKKPLIGDMIVMNESLFEKAEEAKNLTEETAEKEKLMLAVIAAFDVENGVDFEKIILPEGFTGEDGIYTSTKTGKKYVVDKKTGKVNEQKEDEDEEDELLSKAEKSLFQTSAMAVRERLELEKAERVMYNGGKTLDDYSVIKVENISGLDTKIKNEFKDKIVVDKDGNICYDSANVTDEEKGWLEEIGIKVINN